MNEEWWRLKDEWWRMRISSCWGVLMRCRWWWLRWWWRRWWMWCWGWWWRWCRGWWYYGMIEFKVFCGFCFNPDGQTDNKWTDICDCRVAFMTEKIKSADFFHTSWTPPPLPLQCGRFPEILPSKRVKNRQKAPKKHHFSKSTLFIFFFWRLPLWIILNKYKSCFFVQKFIQPHNCLHTTIFKSKIWLSFLTNK